MASSLTSAELPKRLYQEPENRLHFAGLDGLRGVAVLMVLLQHYILSSAKYRWGWIGVRIFFVLSGFLITGILYDTRDAESRWKIFYARRSLRIFPLYYGVLIAGMLLYPFFHWVLHPSYVLWPFYLQNFSRFIWAADIPSGVVDHLRATRYHDPPFFLYYGHFWSLAVEEQFYLIWPLVVFTMKRRVSLMKLCAAVIVLSPVARLVCCLTLSSKLLDAGFEERFTFLQFDSLLLGAFFALWMRGTYPDLTRIGWKIFCTCLGVFCVSEIVCKMLYSHFLIPAIGSPVFSSIGYTCVDFMSIALVLLAIDPRTSFSRLLQMRPLRWLGTISYGFYVFHDLPHVFYDWIIVKLRVPNPHNAMTALLALVGTLLLASVSYYTYERPFLKLKRYFAIPSALSDSRK